MILKYNQIEIVRICEVDDPVTNLIGMQDIAFDIATIYITNFYEYIVPTHINTLLIVD